jgi:hypothetical protein
MTTMTASEGFDMGRVLRRTFGSIGANLGAFGGLAIGLIGLPKFITGWLHVEAAGGGLGEKAIFGPLASLAGLLALVAAVVAQAAINYGTVAEINGQRAPLGKCLSVGWRHWWPVFLVVMLMSLGITLGLILLVVPGIMLAIRWAVAAPVQVIENIGVRASLGRSAELTRGRRWPIFGLALVYALASWAITLTGIRFNGAFSGGMAGYVRGLSSPINLMLVLPIVSTIGGLISAAGLSAIYVELRGAGALEGVAAVFD